MTEDELFAAIYDLGGEIWFINHDLADGRLENSTHIDLWLVDSQARIQELVRQTSQFGVAVPLDENNVATAEYWKWYHRHKVHMDDGRE